MAFCLAQALIFLSPLALLAKCMDVRQTGACVELIGALKNCGKVTRPMLSGWLIYRNIFFMDAVEHESIIGFLELRIIIDYTQ